MKNAHPKGAILLLNVLVMGVMSIAAASILARGSFDGFLQSNEALMAWETRSQTLGCLNEAIIQLQKDHTYSPATVSIGSTSCTLSISSPSAETRVINVQLSENSVTRSITGNVTLDPFTLDLITEP